jgi:amino acid permease
MENMQKIIGYGTLGAGSLYIITGVFGYAAFAAYRGDSYP